MSMNRKLFVGKQPQVDLKVLYKASVVRSLFAFISFTRRTGVIEVRNVLSSVRVKRGQTEDKRESQIMLSRHVVYQTTFIIIE